MKKNYFFRTLSVLLLALLATGISAKSIYVNQTTGDDTANDGLSDTTPFKSISRALLKSDAAAANTTWYGQGLSVVFANGDIIVIDGAYDLTLDPDYRKEGSPVFPGKTGQAAINDGGLFLQGGTMNGNWDYTFQGVNNATLTTNLTGRGIDLRGVNGQITFKDLTFDNCGEATLNQGSAVFAVDNGGTSNEKTVRFEDCTFSNNLCGNGKGTLNFGNKPRAEVINCTFTNNVANEAGALSINGNYEDNVEVTQLADELLKRTRTQLIDGCTFYNNSTKNGNGGAIIIENVYNTIIRNTTIESNKTNTTNTDGRKGAGIFIRNRIHNVLLDNVELLDNITQEHGGGMAIDAARIDGAASRVYGPGAITIQNSIFSGNESGSTKKGGALLINNSNGLIKITGATFDGNSVSGGGSAGGAIALDANASATKQIDVRIESSLFTNNSAGDSGGVLDYTNNYATYTANLTFINTTFYNNVGNGGNGGGVATFGSCLNSNSTFKMINCTVTGNKHTGSTLVGGLRFRDPSYPLRKEIYNCIFEGNLQGNNELNDISIQGPDRGILTADPLVYRYYNIDVQNSYIGKFSCDLITAAGTGSSGGSPDVPKITLPATNVAFYSNGASINPSVGLPTDIAAAFATYGAIPLVKDAAGLTAGDAQYLIAESISTDQLGFTRNFVGGKCAVGAVELDYTTVGVDSETLQPATKEVLSTQYYDLTGKELKTPKGFVIVKTTYTDGSVAASKAIVE
ncbi:hypothetical protein [Viscerimonas tarda]